jgi:hypothetical protein
MMSRLSAIFPSANRSIVHAATATSLSVAGIPRNGPRCVPCHVQRLHTLSSSAICSSSCFLFNPPGPDGLAYAHAHLSFTNVYTNMANDNTVTEVGRAVDKDLRVTDNGDSTLTILRLTTGPAAVYGPDGKALARNPGQVRFEFLVDHGGTPTDPSDDEFLEDLGLVKGSTGRTDDFCAAVVPVLRRLTNGTRCLSSTFCADVRRVERELIELEGPNLELPQVIRQVTAAAAPGPAPGCHLR